MWTTVDLYEQYIKDGGVLLSRRQLLDRVLQATGENFILLKSPGIASLIVPKAYANSTLRLQEVDNEALEADPPALEPTEYGWTKEDEMLLPTTLPDGVDLLPQSYCVQLPNRRTVSSRELHLQEEQNGMLNVL